MNSYTYIFLRALIVGATAVSLVACSSLSKNIARDGSGAEELVWPSPDSTTPLHKGGTSPTPASVRHIRAGMDKDQIANLIGYPHFSEGIASTVREWDYLFHFMTNNGTIQCQYKVLFDKDKLAQSFYWKPDRCAALVNAKYESFTLSANTLFAFDKSHLLPGGRDALDELTNKIKKHQGAIDKIRIVGYTDPMGSKSYNRRLSQERAFAVLFFLEDKGVPGRLMTAVGMGERNLVISDCNQSSRDARLECFAPNRRVDVEVFSRG